jgi:hypothetical protein
MGPTTYLLYSGVAEEVTSSVGRPPPVMPMESDWPAQAQQLRKSIEKCRMPANMQT